MSASISILGFDRIVHSRGTPILSRGEFYVFTGVVESSARDKEGNGPMSVELSNVAVRRSAVNWESVSYVVTALADALACCLIAAGLPPRASEPVVRLGVVDAPMEDRVVGCRNTDGLFLGVTVVQIIALFLSTRRSDPLHTITRLVLVAGAIVQMQTEPSVWFPIFMMFCTLLVGIVALRDAMIQNMARDAELNRRFLGMRGNGCEEKLLKPEA